MKNTPYTRNKNPLNSDMNVVPYIDVMLVLLVIFMVTAPMLTTGVDIDLPKQQTKNITTSTEMPVIVSMKDGGEIFVTFEDEDMPITEPELIDRLSNLQQNNQTQLGQDLQVMIRADQNIQYGNVMSLMASLQEAGVVKVGLLTESPTQKKR